MSEEIQPCPFCGNKDIDISPISGAAWCYDCHSVANDVDRWNTRPLEDALQARIAALEAEAESEIRDWECLSCGWTYRGKDQCPKCGDTAHPLTTAREIAQETRIAALEAETQRQRNALYILEHMILAEHPIQIKCDDDEYFVYTDDGFFDHSEDFIGAVRTADEAWKMSALEGEVKE